MEMFASGTSSESVVGAQVSWPFIGEVGSPSSLVSVNGSEWGRNGSGLILLITNEFVGGREEKVP